MASSKRRYDSPLRQEQVRLTRRRVLEAARPLLLARGYSGMAIDTVAGDAGVSVQTVYNVVGGKAEVLKAVYDVTLAGDDDARPISQRPQVAAVLAAPDARSALAHYASLGRELAERAGPLLQVVLSQAAGGDADLERFAATVEAERRTGNSLTVDHIAKRFGLRPGLTRERATDIVWALTAPEIVDRLVRQRQWSWDDYEAWLAEAMADSLLKQPTPTKRSRRQATSSRRRAPG